MNKNHPAQLLMFAVAFFLWYLPVSGQDPEASGGNTVRRVAPPVPATRTPARATVPTRTLAPHVFKTINPYLDMMNFTNIHDITTYAGASAMDHDWAKDVSYHSSVWYLELEIKPMRTIVLDLPDKTGKLVRQNVWYLMYKVRNPADFMVVQSRKLPIDVTQFRKAIEGVKGYAFPEERRYFEIETVADRTLTFMPIFELITDDEVIFNPETHGKRIVQRRYVDRFIPIAVAAIRQKEDPGRTILDSVQMSMRPIKPGEEVWGVAVWAGVNPTVDTFSIYVSGLTNASKWFADENDPLKGVYRYKTLKLNYWNPGEGNAFRLAPPGGLDYEWIFR